MNEVSAVACRTAGDIEKRQNFLRDAAFKAPGDVVGVGNGSAFNLIAQEIAAFEFGPFRHGADGDGKVGAGLPDGKLHE